MYHLNLKKRKEVLTLVGIFVLVLLASALTVYLLTGKTNQSRVVREPTIQVETPASAGESTAQAQPATQPASGDSFFGRIFASPQGEALVQGETWGEVVAKIAWRLLLAALLGSALAFRARWRVSTVKRNPYVAETQILLAVVAAALMMIVGDNAARAFGIFAAVSLVRFRTNIRDPKEITVLLLSLALGLAAGVGRLDLAIVLTVFSLILLWILESREPKLVYRSMDLKVSSRNVGATQEMLRNLFERHGFDSELRGLNREDGSESPGEIIYSVAVNPVITTDQLSEEILARDAKNVGSIEWEQKKSFSYLYQ
ncbi:MAG TPA: DUF4956 domain-containing protein [Pyrinomonadaceae bacterium]|nr:DUF4956 domain-containing protein [Pyrinomonadaceae bacterium]